MTEPPGVIFDVDGVLVDSYDAHYQSWQVLGEERGFEFTEAQFLATFGRTTRELLVDTFGASFFSGAKIAELDARKEAIFRELRGGLTDVRSPEDGYPSSSILHVGVA